MTIMEETIAAIATPPGEGAIALLRISGEEALNVVDKLFHGARKPSLMKARYVHFGTIVHEGELLDEVLVTVFRAPKSYTGEDLVEVSCHGGSLIAGRLLGAALAAGARMARPGEFTQRAYLNGKMDLTQAEAVMDLISAQTARAQRTAAEQLAGALGQEIQLLRSEILAAVAHLEAFIDFPEDGIEPEVGPVFHARIKASHQHLLRLLSTANEGRLLREGIRVTICGVPNSGKSSLLNRLLGMERAIVSSTPGTTRDSIEEIATLGGFPFRLVDTAGLRETEDLIEQEGMRRAIALAASADVCLHIIDASNIQEAMAFLDSALDRSELQGDLTSGENKPQEQRSQQRKVLIFNKIDLVTDLAPLRQQYPSALMISCVTGEGIDQLGDEIASRIRGHDSSSRSLKEQAPSSLAINARHQAALHHALQAVEATLELIDEKHPPELLAVELKRALEAIGTVVGSAGTEEILGEIFGRFCIGK